LATHHRLREDYEAVLAVGVILEFASTVSQEGLEEPRFFDLTMAVLDALEQLLDEGERTHNADRITLYLVAYLVKGAAMHGYRFDIDEIAGGDVPERVDAQNTARMMRLLTATFAEMSDADSATINDSRQLFEVARTFIRQTIPARFRALDAYLTHLDAY